MKNFFAPLRFIYKLYVGIVYVFLGLVLYPFMLVFIRGRNKYKRALFFKKLWAKLLLMAAFIKVDVKGKENFPLNEPFIVCANHTSYLDIIAMYLIIPRDFAFLGKAEVLKWPIVNIFFKRGIDIPVYRNNVKRAKECIDLAAIALQENRIVAIFPEGGMENNSNKLRRFKNGAFHLAIQSGKPIVPITFVTNWKLFSDHTDLFGSASPGVAKVIIHKPIPTSDLTSKDLVNLRQETFETIKNEL